MPNQRGGLNAEQRRELRRQTLLDSALELFAHRGYLASAIEDLCRHAHVSTKSFYEVFDSRETLYLDLMRRTTEQLKSAMSATLVERGDADAATLTEQLIETFAHLMADDPRRAAVLFGRGTATTFAVERERRTNRRWAASFLERVWAGLEPPPTVTPGVATGVVGGLFDLVADWVADSDDLAEFEVERLVRRMTAYWHVVDRGVRAES